MKSLQVGDVCVLDGASGVGAFKFMVGYICKRDPKTLCVLRLDTLEEGHVGFRLEEAVVYAMVASEVASFL